MMMIPLMQEVRTSVLLLRSYQGAVGPNVEIGGPYSACDPIRSMLKVEVYLDYQYGLRLTELATNIIVDAVDPMTDHSDDRHRHESGSMSSSLSSFISQQFQVVVWYQLDNLMDPAVTRLQMGMDTPYVGCALCAYTLWKQDQGNGQEPGMLNTFSKPWRRSTRCR